MATVSAIEIEKITAQGKEVGLTGQDLLVFIKDERAELRKQRDEEREIRAAEREAEKEKREDEKQKRDDEKQKRDDEKERRENEMAFEREKAETEREFLREQAAAEERRKEVEHKRKIDEYKFRQQEADNKLSREQQSIDKQMQLEESKIRRGESNDSQNVQARRVKAKVPRLPCFDENKDNIDAYLNRFERYATVQEWPTEHWAVNLSALLTGKSLEVYYSMSEKQASDYNVLKLAILNRYELNEEGFRKKFKNCKPEEGESGVQYAQRIIKYFDRWRDLSIVENSKVGFIDFIVRDQFLHSIPKDMAMFIREREPKDIETVSELADHYLKAHHSWWGPSSIQKGTGKNTKQPFVKKPYSTVGSKTGEASGGKSNQYRQNKDRPKPRGTGCYICGKSGHIARDCYKRQHLNALFGEDEEEESNSTDSCDIVAFLMMTQDQSNMFPGHNVYTIENGQELPAMTAACHHQPKSERYVVDGLVGKRQVKLLRDSGCDGVVIKKSLVKESQFTGKVKTVLLIDRTVRRFPIAEIEIDTPYFVGKTFAYVVENPVYPLVLGETEGVREPADPDVTWKLEERINQGDRKTIIPSGKCPLIKKTTRHTDITDETEDRENTSGKPEIQVQIVDEKEVHQSGSYIEPKVQVNTGEQIDEVEPDMRDVELKSKVALVETRSQRLNKVKQIKPLITTPANEEIVTAERLKKKQLEDLTLSKPREMATTGEVKEGKNGSKTKYLWDKGILYREFTSPKVEHGNEFRQVVVPVTYRRHVLQIAHESILGGHQGAKKTSQKVMTNFYWPGLGADIRRYCQSCDMCQRTIPKGRVSRVPLGDMPIIDTPFERVAVDLVGPIKPVTDRGHRYILVLVDYATRYPEAIPLKSIETEVVAEALLDMYSRLGIPKQVLTDRGSQFTSRVMQEVNRLLSIKSLTTTPYHAMCNGLVERYNGVLKSGLKKMCEERPKDWDRYISPLLFAYRETPQSSTAFSPFELLYGRDVRGPMAILKELWTDQSNESETKTTYQYIIDLQDRLEKTCQLAREELRKSKEKYRHQYNKKARLRSFKEGDEVLLLLPTDHNKLLMQWKGPFKITKKLSVMNYQIDMGSRKQTFHANLLKRYYRREQDIPESEEKLGALSVIATAVIEEEKDDEVAAHEPFSMTNEELLHLPPLTPKETEKDVKMSPELDDSQQREVKRILGNFKDVLTDIPGRTNLGEHAIQLSDDVPVRCKPYPIPHALRKDVQKEVDMMLSMGIISKSTSPYACPLTMVVKPDGTYRVCCDTRRLNAKTEFDAEPVADQEEIFSQIAEDHYFSKIDLSKGYWQIPMEEKSKKYATFVTHNGLYKFEVMPFGLVNSAATFSRVMRILLQGLEKVHNYIDDILIHTQTWEEHISIVKEIFRRLRRANLTARPSKCFIGFSELEFLGHMVGRGVMKPKPDKVEAIQNAVRPETKTQLRSFLGLAGYYRKFIPDFSAIACPLTDCTKKGEPNKIRWGNPQEEAFKALKCKLASSPILHLPHLQKTFILRSDASDKGIGAVLLQEHAGEKFPVAYISKKLTKCQRAYSVMEKECLAIIWAILRFQAFLYGREFVIETDHQPLSCLRKSKVANGRIMRWALALQPYRYRLEVIKGTKNVGADYMSRITDIDVDTLSSSPVKGIKICVGIFV